MNRLFMPFMFLIVSVCILSNVAEGREVNRTGSLSAHVQNNFRCGPAVILIVEAPVASYFENDNEKFQRLVGSARATLGGECDKIQNIVIFGKVNGQHAYSGRSSKFQNWKLVGARLPRPVPINRPKRREPAPEEKRNADVKAWQLDPAKEPIRRKVGRFHVQLNKATGRGVGDDEFIFTVSTRGKRANNVIAANFENHQTSCSELMSFKIMVDHRPFDYKKFVSTNKGRDFPPEVHEALKVVREVLSDQCGQLEVLRFNHYQFNGAKNEYYYQGTITKDSGWKLHDGVIATAHDDKRKIVLNIRDVHKPVGIEYKGICEKNPVLPLKPFYCNIWA